MAQALFEALAGGSTCTVDSQTAAAVQSILDSSNIQSSNLTQGDEEDLFQCGKCKKQFTSLPMFVGHKQTRCVPAGLQQSTVRITGDTTLPQSTVRITGDTTLPQSTVCITGDNTLPQSTVRITGDNTLPQSTVRITGDTTLPQSTVRITGDNTLPQSTVRITGDTTLPQSTVHITGDTTLPQSTVHITGDTTLPSAVASSFPSVLPQALSTYSSSNVTCSSPAPAQLSQGLVLGEDLMAFTNLDPSLQPQALHMVAAPFVSRAGSSNLSILSPVNAVTSFCTSGSTGFSSNRVQIQTSPQITLAAPLPASTDKPLTSATKPSPTKAGRRSAQSTVAGTRGEGQVKLQKHNCKVGPHQPLEDSSLKRKLRCQYCDKSFAKNFDLQQHVRAHTGEKPFQCIVCGRAFAQKSNVKKHMATHKVWPSGTKATLPKQPPPSVVLEDKPTCASDEHTQQNHEHKTKGSGVMEVDSGGGQGGSGEGRVKVVVDSSYICQYCPLKFKTYFQLKTHMVQHKQQQVYKCVMKNCTSTHSDLDSFLEHTKTHEDEMSYRCHMCNKYFPSLYDLGVHQYTHSLYPNQGPKPGPRHFQCTKCMNKYCSPEALEQHMSSSTHSYGCPHCDKVFACERYLRRHLPTHGTEGQFDCGICGKRFKSDNYLKTHMFIHTGEKPYKCETCNACFNRKDKLKRHLLIHNAVKKYRCPFKSLTGCQKEFNRPDKLKAHIVTHSGIKPFRCRECGKGFSRRPHLLEHERGHKADYKFRCDKCGKGFFRPKLFHDHKCVPSRLGMEPQVFRPRHRRKIGRPKKRMITVTSERLRESRTGRSRAKDNQSLVSHNTILHSMSMEGDKVTLPVAMIDKVQDSQNAINFSEDEKHDIASGQHVSLKQPVASGDQILDHYVVHLTESVSENGSTIQTFIPTVSGNQVLHTADSVPGTLQPITIIETQPVHMTVTTDGNHLHSAGSRLPLVAIPRSEGESMVATQVVVTDATGVDHTIVSCPSHLVDYDHSISETV